MRVLLLIVVLAIGAGVYWFSTANSLTFRLSEPQLRAIANAQAPYENSYYSLFDVTLDNLRVDLEDGSDRIAAGADIKLVLDLGFAMIPLNGAADFTGGLEYRPEAGAFFLKDPVITDLRIQGVPARYADRSHEVVSLALAEYYELQPVYSLEDTRASHMAARLLLKEIEIKDEHLIVTLGRNEVEQ